MLEILRSRDVEFDVIEYLKTPLSRDDFQRFLELLPIEPTELVRKDKLYKELGLEVSDSATKDEVIEVLLEHPRLMQRPVCIKGDEAVLARPSSLVEALL